MDIVKNIESSFGDFKKSLTLNVLKYLDLITTPGVDVKMVDIQYNLLKSRLLILLSSSYSSEVLSANIDTFINSIITYTISQRGDITNAIEDVITQFIDNNPILLPENFLKLELCVETIIFNNKLDNKRIQAVLTQLFDKSNIVNLMLESDMTVPDPLFAFLGLICYSILLLHGESPYLKELQNTQIDDAYVIIKGRLKLLLDEPNYKDVSSKLEIIEELFWLISSKLGTQKIANIIKDLSSESFALLSI